MTECPLDIDHAIANEANRTGDTVGSLLDEHVNHCPACQARIQERIHRSDTIELPLSMNGPGSSPVFPGLEILGELGRGGMGVVFQAWDPQASRHVALKIMPGGPTSGRQGQARWLREARSATRVKHPNIVQLYQVVESGGWLGLVLEFVAGGSLADRLKGPMAPRDAAELLRPVASAIGELHREGVFHLDLKPSNILLDSPPNAPWRDARPKVADFGIARSIAELDSSRMTLAAPAGSPSYMAPEQAEPRPRAIGPASDVYAIGATLYELLTGRPPFVAASTLETLELVRTRDPVPPRSLNPKVPRDLETITLKCLQKEPSRRYPTAEALAEDLDRWLAGRPVKAKPVSPAGVAWRWCRRNPVVALLSTFLVTALFGGLAAASWISWRLHVDQLEAEANAHAAGDALAQLLRADLDLTSRIYDLETFIPNTQDVRSILVELVGRPSNGLAFHRQLARADQVLGESLIRARRHAEARPYFEEALRLSDEYLRADPVDQSARNLRVGSLIRLAETASYLEDPEACLEYQKRYVAEAEVLVREAPNGPQIAYLAQCRGDLAVRLARKGDVDLARSLLEANRRMLESVPFEVEGPEIVAARAFDRMRLTRPEFPLALEDPARSDPASPDDLDGPEWAELALETLQAANRGQADSGHEFRAAYEFSVRLTIFSAKQRHAGRLDLSKQTAGRTLALGRLLVDRDPRSADARMVLGEAYIQAYKNAWQDGDRAAVDRYLRLSIDSIHQALALDPGLSHARGIADQRLLRLKGIEAELAPADASPNASGSARR